MSDEDLAADCTADLDGAAASAAQPPRVSDKEDTADLNGAAASAAQPPRVSDEEDLDGAAASAAQPPTVEGQSDGTMPVRRQNSREASRSRSWRDTRS